MSKYTVQEIAKLRVIANQARLDNSHILNKYKNKELTEVMNGIGAEWMPEKLRDAVTNLNPSLEVVALIHDVECHEASQKGSGATEADFIASNERFKCNGCRMAEYNYSWWQWQRYRVKNRAKVFAKILQEFGRSAFFGENKPA